MLTDTAYALTPACKSNSLLLARCNSDWVCTIFADVINARRNVRLTQLANHLVRIISSPNETKSWQRSIHTSSSHWCLLENSVRIVVVACISNDTSSSRCCLSEISVRIVVAASISNDTSSSRCWFLQNSVRILVVAGTYRCVTRIGKLSMRPSCCKLRWYVPRPW